MPTETELINAFHVYFDEIRHCIDRKCYWALLHVMIVLPDICGALESKNGEATQARYKNWCERYIEDPLISKEEWYDIRCIILHQGRTLGKKGSRYKVYSFGQPDMNGNMVHRVVRSQNVLCLDVGEMANEVTNGMREWFDDLKSKKVPSFSSNVERNLQSLAGIIQPQNTVLMGNPPILINLSTSSPNHFT